MGKKPTPPRPDTLVIVYMDGKREGFKKVKDLAAVEKIVSKRNATKIQSVTYGDKSYDISKHQKIYHNKVSEIKSKNTQS